MLSTGGLVRRGTTPPLLSQGRDRNLLYCSGAAVSTELPLFRGSAYSHRLPASLIPKAKLLTLFFVVLLPSLGVIRRLLTLLT